MLTISGQGCSTNERVGVPFRHPVRGLRWAGAHQVGGIPTVTRARSWRGGRRGCGNAAGRFRGVVCGHAPCSCSAPNQSDRTRAGNGGSGRRIPTVDAVRSRVLAGRPCAGAGVGTLAVP